MAFKLVHVVILAMLTSRPPTVNFMGKKASMNFAGCEFMVSPLAFAKASVGHPFILGTSWKINFFILSLTVFPLS
jgi:hypothetical protein